MGLFTIKCFNPECNQRIRRGAKYCPKCGAGAPTGTVKCGACGEDVRGSSKFCWNCGADLDVESVPKFTSGRWARSPRDFAIRIDGDDVKGWLLKPLIVEAGTKALLFQAGKAVGELEAGRYDMGGFLARLSNCMIDRAASVVLMDAGDVTLDLENGDLWTADKHEVGTALRLVLRVVEPEKLFANLIKGRGRITLDGVENLTAGEAQMLLTGIVAEYQAEQLFSTLDARYEIETKLREHLNTTLGEFGLILVQLRFISFVGTAFEELRRQGAALLFKEKEGDNTVQRYLLIQRMREALTREKMHELKDGKDFDEFARQIEHELGLKKVIRDDEMERLTARFQFERDREGLLRRIEIEGIENDNLRDQAWKQLLHEERERDELHRGELERNLATSQNQAEIRKIEIQIERLEHEEDVRQAEEGQRLLKRQLDIDFEDDQRREKLRMESERHTVTLEGQQLEQRSKATVAALLTIVEGDAANKLGELEKLRIQKDMTPMQLLTIAAEASPEAAEALAKKYEVEGRISDEVKAQMQARIDDIKNLSRDAAERQQDIMNAALEQMGAVAATRARPIEPTQTVVTPGGIGAPIVVNPPTSRASKKCINQKCGALLKPADKFCEECGTKQ